MLQDKIKDIIEKNLPGFWFSVFPYKGAVGGNFIAIKIAAKDRRINDVTGQRPQAVSLSLNTDTMELQPQVYGGMGGRRIYRKPNMQDDKEKYLAMKGVDIPFRTPKPNEEAVLKAIDNFTKNYKKLLIENKDVLMDQDLVDYNALLK